MAVTKIHAIKTTLSKALDYIENPDKTEGQLLVSGYNVDPLTASIEFEMTAALSREIKGNYTKTGGSNNLAYHLIQSFAPTDNVTPEKAHELGKKLADEFLGGHHEYVISTHVDKGHTHNHIILNAVSFYDHKKLITQPYKTAAKIRAISDQICSEHDLSVIKERGKLGYSYGEWKARKQNTSWKSEIRKSLAYVLETATSYEEYKSKAAALGVNVIDNGKHIKYQIGGQEKATRGNKLSDDDKYLPEGIRRQITANLHNIKYIKDAIKTVAPAADSYDEFISTLKEHYSITIKTQKSGKTIFAINDMNDSKVVNRALGTAFGLEEIKAAIRNKEYLFEEDIITDEQYLEEFNQGVKTKAYDNDTRLVLEDKNIAKITTDGILLELPDDEGQLGKVFIDIRHVKYISETKNYEIFVGDKFDYYFVNEQINPDVLESEQLSARYIKGENIIRNIEITNKIEPIKIEISSSDVKSFSANGITITLPDTGIQSLFVENEFVQYDRANNSCMVTLYDNWNYGYHKLETEQIKNEKSTIKGKDIISILNNRDGDNKTLEGRLRNLERRNTTAKIKNLSKTLLLVRSEGINNLSDFDVMLANITKQINEVTVKLHDKEGTVKQYKDVLKYLLAYKQYLPISQEASTQSPFHKKAFEQRHDGELRAFNHATEKLAQLGVDTNVDTNKLKTLIKNTEKDISELQASRNNRMQDKNDLQEAKNTILNLQQDNTPEKRHEPRR